MTDVVEFHREVSENIGRQALDPAFLAASHDWMVASARLRYSYNFTWLGLPIVQYPQDIVAVQQVVWNVRPTLIIETGVARGGSLVLSASMLALLDRAEPSSGGPPREVVGIDIDVRPWNRESIRSHPLGGTIRLIEGSSTAPEVVKQVRVLAQSHPRVLVLLDSDHTHAHVLGELRAFADLVTPGSYCIVSDTFVEHLPDDALHGRPWAAGNSPGSAVQQFLAENDDFEIDVEMDERLMLSTARHGYLRRVR